MKPKKRQKLCHNCEGEIDLDVIVCPFCAADLREEKPEQKYSSYVTRTKESVQPLYPTQEEAAAPAVQVEEKPVHPILPILFFTVGVQLAVFSLLMLLFSHGGEVILKWDARFWFFYLFASVPFLVLGGKYLTKVN